jgi:VanZ family protein
MPIRIDKVVHLLLFFFLCLFAWRAFHHQRRFPSLKQYALLWAFLFATLYGVLDEIHQVYVPGRASDVYDIAADGFGALCYVGLNLWRARRAEMFREKKSI